MATAPGFADYLPFLKPLAESDGFWTGVVEAFVPAFVLSHLLIAALLAVYRESTSELVAKVLQYLGRQKLICGRVIETSSLCIRVPSAGSCVQSVLLVSGRSRSLSTSPLYEF